MLKDENISIEGYLPPQYVEEIVRLHRINPFAALLGIAIDGLAEGYCRLRFPVETNSTNPYGGVHGGVFASLADISMGIALRTVGLQPVTAELTVNYLGQSHSGDELVAEGRVVHRGNTIILTECTVKSGGDKMTAMARGVFMSRGLLLSDNEK